MTHAGNQTDNESSGCQSHEIPSIKLHTDLAAYRLLRNKVSATLKRAKESYKTSLIEENSSDSESIWRSVKKLLPDAKLKSIPTCIKADDKIITDIQSISELFNSFFTFVVNKLFESCRYARPVFKSTTEELFYKETLWAHSNG